MCSYLASIFSQVQYLRTKHGSLSIEWGTMVGHGWSRAIGRIADHITTISQPIKQQNKQNYFENVARF
jgi:hypothetical protein